jgi:predicted metalloprotease with PDZ domain
VPHEVAISGRHDCDLARLTADLQRICEWQIRFFGEPAPMPHYLFLVTAVGDGYGGLEHRASTALLCARDDLPYAGMQGMPERYRTFLGLCSHEYFHTWNVKRIKPAAFTAYNLDAENYTTLLWAFEGFTSYYDDLALLRCGLIETKDWLELVAQTIDKVQRDPGRKRQTLAESSFDAWTKYYRPDENTPERGRQLLRQGRPGGAGARPDLRAGTSGRVSLDDVMRALWQRHGERRAAASVSATTTSGCSPKNCPASTSSAFLPKRTRHDDLDLARLLKPFGIRLQARGSSDDADARRENRQRRQRSPADDGV